MSYKCGHAVMLLRSDDGVFVEQAYRCKKLTCDSCREQAKEGLFRQLMYYVPRYDMTTFLTLTIPHGEDSKVLERLFKKLRRELERMTLEGFRKRFKQGAEWRWDTYIQQLVEKEIYWQFRFKYTYDICIKIASRLGVNYTQLKDKQAFQSAHRDEIDNEVKERIKAFKDGRAKLFEEKRDKDRPDFVPLVHLSYKSLEDRVRERILKNIDEPLEFVRVAEFQQNGTMHYHILMNRYPCDAMLKDVLGSYIYDVRDLAETRSSNRSAEQTYKDTVEYILKYITKESAELASTSKRLISSSASVKATLFESEKSDDKKYQLLGTFERMPQASWRELSAKTEEEAIRSVESLRKVVDYDNPFVSILLDLYRQNQELKYSDAPSSEKKRGAERFEDERSLYRTLWLENEFRRRDGCKFVDLSHVDFSTITEHDDFKDNDEAKQFVSSLKDPGKFFFLLGGDAGTGKTYLGTRIVRVLRDHGLSVAVAAYTGRAKNRLNEVAPDTEAETIHSLCGGGFSKTIPLFRNNAANPLPYDVILCDEASLIDKTLLAALMNACKLSCRFIFMGDIKQLNPVGSNSIITELLESNLASFSYTELKKIYRYGGKIAEVARMVLEGVFNDYKAYDLDTVSELSLNGFKVLCNSVKLTEEINMHIHRDKQGGTKHTAFYSYVPGDEVLIVQNDHRNDLYNGDIVKVSSISDAGVYLLTTDGRTVFYSNVSTATYIRPASCFSVHKAQGSEFDKVAVVLDNSSMLLSRNMLYTAVTRAKEEVRVFVKDRVDLSKLKEPQGREERYSIFRIDEQLSEEIS